MNSVFFQRLSAVLQLRPKFYYNIYPRSLSYSCLKENLLQSTTSKSVGLHTFAQALCRHSEFIGILKNNRRSLESSRSFHQSCQCLANYRNKTKRNDKRHGKRPDDIVAENNIVPMSVTRQRIKIVKETDKIQLFSLDDLFVGVRTLAQAREHAKEEGLILSKLKGSVTDKDIPSYKLMTKEMMLESRHAEKAMKKKNPKQHDISVKITLHDLEHKMTKMTEHLSKGIPVKVIVKGKKSDDNTGVMALVKKISETLDPVGYIQNSITNSSGVSEILYTPRKQKQMEKDEESDEED